MNILSLPVELQSEILSHLPWHDHFLASTVCTLWNSILQRHSFRTKRHYDHTVPAEWPIADHPHPVYDAPTPRVLSNLYTPTDAPNTHVLLEMGVLMFEITASGETTIFMKIPREHIPAGGSLATNHEVTRTDQGDVESAQYAELWGALVPEENAVIDIGSSPLLSSDKLVFSIRESDSEEGVDTSSLRLPGLPDGDRKLAFRIWDWNRANSQFQAFATVPSGLAINDPQWCLKQWDWPRGSPAELVGVVKEHLRTHVWCNSGVLKCFVQVEGFNMYGDAPGETINITIAAFPRAAA
ncbi:hypothetical protein TWF481_007690 [Arthrobotrys musiformis]|uniref:F-box domain-containing protein n=1 Tax=Arthrobotrys musiformis TaxID=47236 RepID=A0AAV9WEG8_9PEZI